MAFQYKIFRMIKITLLSNRHIVNKSNFSSLIRCKLKMKLLSIHQRSVYVSYKNTVCSCATLFLAATTFFAIVLPVYLIFLINPKVWLENVEIYEQPRVQFNYQYDLLAITEDNQIVSCSSLDYQIERFGRSDCLLIKVRIHL